MKFLFLCGFIIICFLTIINGQKSDLKAQVKLFNKNMEKVTITDHVDKDKVMIKIVGPSTVWFGVGFNGTDMNGTYAIVCGGGTNKCQENVLAHGGPGVELPVTLELQYDNLNVTDGTRTVKFQRKRIITSSDNSQWQMYYTFPSDPVISNTIAAYGTDATFTNTSHMANATVCVLNYTVNT
eukprot:167571_1